MHDVLAALGLVGVKEAHLCVVGTAEGHETLKGFFIAHLRGRHVCLVWCVPLSFGVLVQQHVVAIGHDEAQVAAAVHGRAVRNGCAVGLGNAVIARGKEHQGKHIHSHRHIVEEKEVGAVEVHIDIEHEEVDPLRHRYAGAYPEEEAQLAARLVVEERGGKAVGVVIAVDAAACTAHPEAAPHDDGVQAHKRTNGEEHDACDVWYPGVETGTVKTAVENRAHMQKHQHEHHKCRYDERAAHSPCYAQAHLLRIHASRVHDGRNHISKHQEDSRQQGFVDKPARGRGKRHEAYRYRPAAEQRPQRDRYYRRVSHFSLELKKSSILAYTTARELQPLMLWFILGKMNMSQRMPAF